MIRQWVRESIDEPIAEMMIRHVWPKVDPRRMTVSDFEAAIAIIPEDVRKRFGYGMMDRDRLEFEQSEFERIEAYTNF
jgi:hypothetical protein